MYFQFVFSGHPMPLDRVADRLLEAEVAETVSSPVDGLVRMSPRYGELAKHLTKLERLAALSRELEGGPNLGMLWRHPVLGWIRLRVFIQRILGRTGVPAARGEPVASDDGTDAARTRTELADELDQTQQEIKLSVAKRQAHSAIQHAREQDLYQPAYLESEPYVRLSLRALRYAIEDLDVADEPGQDADVLLLAHRSGVYEVLIPCRLPPGIETDELIPRTQASGVVLDWVEMAEPVLAAAQRSAPEPMRLSGEWLEDTAEGTRWRRFQHEHGTLVDIFHIYLDAIQEVVGFKMRGDAWFCYASTFLTPACCTGERTWRRAHGNELLGIVARHTAYRGLRKNSQPGIAKDSAITAGHSAWVGSASATVISWEDVQDRSQFDSHLWTLLLVEYYLLQNWQIRTLLAELPSAQSDPKSARDLQRRLIHGLGEFYSSDLSYGSAQDIINDLLKEAGVDRMHNHLVARIDQLANLTAAERAEQASTRGLVAAILATAATAVLALPALTQTLDAVRSLPESGVSGWFATPLRGLSNAGEAGAWLAYLVLLGVAGSAWAFTAVRLAFRRRKHRVKTVTWRPLGLDWIGGSVRIERRPPKP
ncbi:hypothetical protein ACFPJ1_26210 [Kribbella qitaiheensis]|uniref:hypothetical protein n=1 Tax=Kribbella qitaiheensis TaxID=1544730 RepID=UPI00361382D7